MTPYQFGQFVKQAIGPGEYFKPRSMLPPAPPPSKPQATQIPIIAPTLDSQITLPSATPELAQSPDVTAARDTTHPAYASWLNQNYMGKMRPAVFSRIYGHLQQHPGAYDKYKTHTQNVADRQARNSLVPFTEENPPGMPLVASHAVMTNKPMTNKPTIRIGQDEFIGQRAPFGVPLAGQLLSTVLPEHQISRAMMGRNKYNPAETRGIIKSHELEHANGDISNWASEENVTTTKTPGGGQFTWRMLPNSAATARQFAVESPAIIKELMLGAEAAQKVTGKPVHAPVPLSPNYQPDLEWMRSQAQRHGMDLGQGGKLPTELLQTPAGQAWLRYQLRDHATKPIQ